jgi:hypothetical protein
MNRRVAAIRGVQGVLALPEANGTDDMCDAAVEAELKPWRPYG